MRGTYLKPKSYLLAFILILLSGFVLSCAKPFRANPKAGQKTFSDIGDESPAAEIAQSTSFSRRGGTYFAFQGGEETALPSKPSGNRPLYNVLKQFISKSKIFDTYLSNQLEQIEVNYITDNDDSQIPTNSGSQPSKVLKSLEIKLKFKSSGDGLPSLLVLKATKPDGKKWWDDDLLLTTVVESVETENGEISPTFDFKKYKISVRCENERSKNPTSCSLVSVTLVGEKIDDETQNGLAFFHEVKDENLTLIDSNSSGSSAFKKVKALSDKKKLIYRDNTTVINGPSKTRLIMELDEGAQLRIFSELVQTSQKVNTTGLSKGIYTDPDGNEFDIECNLIGNDDIGGNIRIRCIDPNQDVEEEFEEGTEEESEDDSESELDSEDSQGDDDDGSPEDTSTTDDDDSSDDSGNSSESTPPFVINDSSDLDSSTENLKKGDDQSGNSKPDLLGQGKEPPKDTNTADIKDKKKKKKKKRKKKKVQTAFIDIYIGTEFNRYNPYRNKFSEANLNEIYDHETALLKIPAKHRHQLIDLYNRVYGDPFFNQWINILTTETGGIQVCDYMKLKNKGLDVTDHSVNIENIPDHLQPNIVSNLGDTQNLFKYLPPTEKYLQDVYRASGVSIEGALYISRESSGYLSDRKSSEIYEIEPAGKEGEGSIGPFQIWDNTLNDLLKEKTSDGRSCKIDGVKDSLININSKYSDKIGFKTACDSGYKNKHYTVIGRGGSKRAEHNDDPRNSLVSSAIIASYLQGQVYRSTGKRSDLVPIGYNGGRGFEHLKFCKGESNKEECKKREACKAINIDPNSRRCDKYYILQPHIISDPHNSLNNLVWLNGDINEKEYDDDKKYKAEENCKKLDYAYHIAALRAISANPGRYNTKDFQYENHKLNYTPTATQMNIFKKTEK